MTPTKQLNKRQTGWALAKSSWYVLRLDRELVLLPLIGFIASIFAIAPFMIGILFTGTTLNSQGAEFDIGWLWLPFGLAVCMIGTTITNFFAGALTFGVIQRFRGEDPSIKSCLEAAWKRKGPLALYSLFAATIGFTLGQIEQRVPFAGKIVVWLVDAAWNIANLFAVPIIMMDDHQTKPLEASRRSAGMIKKIWGEGVVAQFSLALIIALVVLGWIGVIALLAVGAVLLNAGAVVGIVGAILALLSFFALILVLSTLDAVVRTAIFYYATTGQSPERFNKDLMQAAFTPKKARKIFA